MEERRRWELSAFSLHLVAMGAMFCDHIWVSGLLKNLWLTCVGRLAYPIFAFLIAEGFSRTRSVGRYMGRMLVAAILSEIPFDLLLSGRPLDPSRQNVLWTFFISLGCLWLLERSREVRDSFLSLASGAGAVILAFLLANIARVDYYGSGVLMVLVFYFFREGDGACRWGQLAGMYILNCILLSGTAIPVNLWGMTLSPPLQSFALLALPLIWLYGGRQGPHNRLIRVCFYGFYPLHLLALAGASAPLR